MIEDIAKKYHTAMCSFLDSKDRTVQAERWNSLTEGHRHWHRVEVENFILFAKQAGYKLEKM